MFFPGDLYVLGTDTNFPVGFIEQTCFFKKVLSVRRMFVESHRTETNPYLVLEHKRTFQELLFFHRTDIHIQEALSSP